MTRQELFEKNYADMHGLPAETFAQYRMADSYRLPEIARAYRWFCRGWDAHQAEHERTNEEFLAHFADYEHEDTL